MIGDRAARLVRWRRSVNWLVAAATFALACPAIAQAPSDRAQALFDKVKDSLLTVRLLIKSSQAQHVIGSGFVVSADGLVITNFHVISDLAYHPERYSGQYRRNDGSTGVVEIVDIDVVNDLAVLRTDITNSEFLTLKDVRLSKGQSLFSLGNPLNLGLTVVEGTFSGVVEDSRHGQLHFSGAINPGMSGGPVLLPDGSVVGINVSRHGFGELVSFLVPASSAIKLISATRHAKPAPAFALNERIRDQIRADQQAALEPIVANPWPSTKLGHYAVPDKPNRFVTCWGSTMDEKKILYVSTIHGCQTRDWIYIGQGRVTGYMRFSHTHFASKGLGWARFYKLVESSFSSSHYERGDLEDQTEFRCHDDFVDSAGRTMRAVLCLRAYKKLQGLYDLRLKMVSLDSSSDAVLSDLDVSGATYETAIAVARKNLTSITW